MIADTGRRGKLLLRNLNPLRRRAPFSYNARARTVACRGAARRLDSNKEGIVKSRICILVVLLLALAAGPAGAADPHAITFDDLISLGRIGSFAVSPDGRLVAFELTWFDKDENSSNTDIYLVPVAGGAPSEFVRSGADDSSPAWSADGTRLAFLSDRDGTSQIWVIPVDGGEAKRITDIPTGVSNFAWSPDGRTIALTSSVYPECADMACNAKMLDDAKKAKVKARVVDYLLYRHWNSWRNGKWSHLFITNADGGPLVEVTKGRTDVPPIALGGDRDIDFAPDGAELCFTMNPDSMPAISTNNDVYVMAVPGGTPVAITAKNRGNDFNPRYSPDGRFIAYCSMPTPGLESDRVRIMLYDRKSKTISNLTENFDYSIDHVAWGADSKSLYFSVEDRGRRAIGAVSIKGGDAALVIRGAFDTDLAATRDGKYLVFARQSAIHPVDLYRATVKGKDIKPLTNINADVLAGLRMNAVEEYWYDGALGAKIHCYIVKPPFYEEGTKYPVILLIHGGPQGSFGDDFHYRWNSQMFASPGYVVAMINPHGSTGYGDAFERQISGDWGGAAFEDVLKSVDFLKTLPFIDGTRVAAAGASYGGYMIDWLEGHTNGLFRCLVSHDGVYNLESMYGATEELWFPEWEFRGTPWTNPEMYAKWSPHRFAANFSTPCLVVHGEQDFRVPFEEGLQLFTALQRRGVPSKLLYFPDEGHFVTKPLNAELWWSTLQDWFAEYLK
jgi:dipeptidyl aminopeptidase/acylaminoacyl peptidase